MECFIGIYQLLVEYKMGSKIHISTYFKILIKYLKFKYLINIKFNAYKTVVIW